jgi:hypothetical protein
VPELIEERTRQIVEQACSALVSITHTGDKAQEFEAFVAFHVHEVDVSIKSLPSRSRALVAFKRRLGILKTLGDGLVWRLFPTEVLAYSSALPVRRRSSLEEYRLERELVKDTFRLSGSALVIQNDATHVLRRGDISVLHTTGEVFTLGSRDRSGRRGRMSAKNAGKKKASFPTVPHMLPWDFDAGGQVRQFPEDNPFELSTFIAHGRPLERASRTPFRLLRTDYRWSTLEQVAQSAAKNGSAHQIVDDFVLIFCCRAELFGRAEAMKNIQAALDKAEWKSGEFVYLNRHVFDPRLAEDAVGTRPVSAFDLNEEVMTQLIFGDVIALSFANWDAAKPRFAGHGISIDRNANGEWMFNDEISGMNFQVHGIQTALASELRKMSAIARDVNDIKKNLRSLFQSTKNKVR